MAGAEEMLDALLPPPPATARMLAAALKRFIIERTEGNPFFMEEIVQALFEDGALLRNGSVKLARSMNAVKVPATVQAVAGRAHRPAAARGKGIAANSRGHRPGVSRSPRQKSLPADRDRTRWHALAFAGRGIHL